MKARIALCLGIVSLAIPLSTVVAEDVNEIFVRTKKFIDAENYPKALEQYKKLLLHAKLLKSWSGQRKK